MGGRERGSSESSTRSERSDTVSQGDDTTSQKSDPSPLVSNGFMASCVFFLEGGWEGVY